MSLSTVSVLNSIYNIPCHLYVMNSTDPASITQSLVNLVRNQTFNAVFTCIVQGIPRPVIRWSRSPPTANNFTNLTNSTKFIISEDLEVDSLNQNTITATLEITSLVKLEDDGYYRCTATNGIDNFIDSQDTSTANLLIQGISKYDLVTVDFIPFILLCLQFLQQFLLIPHQLN